MKKEGNHKRAQRVQKGVKTESYKKGGTQEEKKNGEKKVSKIRVVVVVGAPKSLKNFQKTKNKNSLGVLSFKIKARRPTTLIKANKKLLRVTKEREREREDGTAA